MNQDELTPVVAELATMLETAQRLQRDQHPQLAGDIERIIAILADKIRQLDPEQFEHVTEYE